ncbi:hypothetical protein D5R81_18325 [Parashewanella spongiae]|uniref:Uncharacterized protein n=1 Tax=Parashewanella spongiae TaxID=342950 RepID=A0A3A6TMW2_9GAMM|nr:hypothetical protein [Parashewanella spongiae]MCL1080064.1 hypothetical protein [Parashewanella spongiae]RJY05978.1 hypothetical protein D5R81_18325 [Parashewanella spongiae]
MRVDAYSPVDGLANRVIFIFLLASIIEEADSLGDKLGSVELSGLNFVLFEHLFVQGVSSDA